VEEVSVAEEEEEEVEVAVKSEGLKVCHLSWDFLTFSARRGFGFLGS
jgi:hypothetical protein